MALGLISLRYHCQERQSVGQKDSGLANLTVVHVLFWDAMANIASSLATTLYLGNVILLTNRFSACNVITSLRPNQALV